MQILDVKIDWRYKDIDADPDIHILVDDIPRDFVYHNKGNLYWAENDGYVSYFLSGMGNNTHMEVQMDSGEIRTVSGIECPSESIMVKNGINCVRVVLTDSEKAFGCVMPHGFAAVSINKLLEKLPPEYELITERFRYYPVKKGVKRRCMRCKGSGRCDKALNWSDPLKLVLCPECSGRGSII